VVLIFAGPIGYYEKFNVWKDSVEEAGWKRSQLIWINAYNQGRSGPQLARLLGTSMLMGWEWPKDADLRYLPAGRVNWPARGAELLLVILVAGCLPWPGRWRMGSSAQTRVPGNSARDPALRSTSEPAWEQPETQWRILLWLCLWIVIPAYCFYCRSMPGFAGPRDGWQWLIHQAPLLNHGWIWVLPVLLAGFAICYRRTRLLALRAAGLLAVLGIVIGLCQVIALVMTSLSEAALEAGKPWESLWVPRYMGFIWPMLAVAVAALLMRLPTRGLRGAAIVFLLGLNLGIGCFRIFGQTEPPVDLMAADVFDAEEASHHTLTWTHLAASQDSPGSENIYGEPGQYYLQMLENKPMDPVLFRLAVAQRKSKNPGLRAMPWDREMPADVRRIILWSEYDLSGQVQVVEPRVPPDWKLQSDQLFIARDCWIWQDLARYRRSVYVKSAED
jgi:hypothetical protein